MGVQTFKTRIVFTTTLSDLLVIAYFHCRRLIYETGLARNEAMVLLSHVTKQFIFTRHSKTDIMRQLSRNVAREEVST